MATSILKNTAQEVVVKVAGTAGSDTISLATDILAPTQELDGGTQTVNIVGIAWMGAVGSSIQITRNSTVVMTMGSEAAALFDFTGQGMVPDTTENTSDLTVTITGTQAECWIRLRKVSGYKTKVEYATYGSYEDESRVGASTTINGSPDYVPPPSP